MKNVPKPLIAVLVVLVVLFLAGTGLGVSGGLPGIEVDGVIQQLTGLFGGGAPVNPDDIAATPESCLNRDLRRLIVPQFGGCGITVAASEANVRSFRLVIAPGASLNLRTTISPLEGRTMTINQELPRETVDGSPPNEIKLDFYRDGGVLVIDQCVPASGQSACVLDIG